jgi:hypothetical protein
MKMTLLVTIAFVAVAVLPAAAAERAPASLSPMQVADTDDFASKKADYEARAAREMDLWQHRMHEAGAEAQANGERFARSAQEELDQAWAATKDHWVGLQQSTAASWDRTRIAFEHASAQMKAEWRKFHPDDQ